MSPSRDYAAFGCQSRRIRHVLRDSDWQKIEAAAAESGVTLAVWIDAALHIYLIDRELRETAQARYLADAGIRTTDQEPAQ